LKKRNPGGRKDFYHQEFLILRGTGGENYYAREMEGLESVTLAGGPPEKITDRCRIKKSSTSAKGKKLVGGPETCATEGRLLE